MRTNLVLPIILLWTLLTEAQNSTKAKGEVSLTPTFSASGEAVLTSHFVYHGLSMSNSNPAVNANLLLHMGPQFRVGFWAANISNVTNPDDHLWVQIQGVITVDFLNQTKTTLTIADHNFYTSEQRNGQSATFDVLYKQRFSGKLEFQTNFEGTGTSSQHYRAGYLHRFKGPWFASGQLGYTNEQSDQINSFLDTQIEGIYQPLPKMNFKLGTTFTSDAGQLNGRGGFHYYLSGEFLF